MNTQQLFDKVATHLLAQKAPAMSCGGCMYRGDDGMMCAVGCLIDDKAYSPRLEGLSLSDKGGGSAEVIVDAVRRSIGRDLDHDEIAMLRELQQLHDNAGGVAPTGDVDQWPEGLRKIATRYALSAEVVDNA